MHSTHRVPADRRRTLSLVTAIVALACAALLAASVVVDLGGAENGLIFAMIPLVLSATAAVLLLAKPGKIELIQLDDDGITHVLGGLKREWAWDQVAAIDLAEPTIDGSGATVRFTNGQLLHFGGATEDSRAIVAALTSRCPDATREPVRARHKRRVAAGLAGVTLVCGGVAAWAVIAYTNGEPLELAQPAVALVTPAVISVILLIAVLVTGRR
ncbi:hypothetical protein PV646_18820 [Streptomyces sp. ID05-26A]|nr:hypothetical protein [Streptomyces sp. ID05-26A]